MVIRKYTKKQAKTYTVNWYKERQFFHYRGCRSYEEGKKEIKEQFEKDAQQFYKSNGDTVDVWRACEYWKQYPHWALLIGTEKNGWIKPDDTYYALNCAFWEAVRLIERTVEAEGLRTSQVIRECAKLEQDIIDTDPEKYWDADDFGGMKMPLTWPDCLGRYRRNLAAKRQRTISEGETAVEQLRVILENKLRAEGRWHGGNYLAPAQTKPHDAKQDKRKTAEADKKPTLESLGENEWLSARGIANYFHLKDKPAENLRKALMNWKASDDPEAIGGKNWRKDEKKGPRDSQYSFRVGAVRHILRKYMPS